MVSNASDDFPEPDSPVMTTSDSRGSDSEMSRRLCSRAPEMTIAFLFGGIHGVVYVGERTFASLGSRTFRRSALEAARDRPERAERRLAHRSPARVQPPQAAVGERVA